MSLKRPSYFLRMVFFVLKYKGQPFAMAWLKQERANPLILSSVLYIAKATPSPLKLYTSCSITCPSSPSNLMVNLPLPLVTKSVARY